MHIEEWPLRPRIHFKHGVSADIYFPTAPSYLHGDKNVYHWAAKTVFVVILQTDKTLMKRWKLSLKKLLIEVK